MATNIKVDDLLSRWECAQRQGKTISLEELCRDCPELRIELQGMIQALGEMDRVLDECTTQQAFDQPMTNANPDPHTSMNNFRPGWEPVSGYRLENRLGKGGFGEVWKATGPGGFSLALKFVPLAGLIRSQELRSLEIIKGLRHPHLLTIIGAWQIDGFLIIGMELADRTLWDRFQEAVSQGSGPGIPRTELLRYMEEAAEALDYLNTPHHAFADLSQVSVQHRDIKPQNILLVGARAKIGDFGLLRMLRHATTTHTGSLTAAYAPPEFFNGRTSRSSDQYSLAITYCHLGGGRLPFTGHAGQVMAGHLKEAPDLSMIPAEERPSVLRALAKDPENRWPTCAAFIDALRSCQTTRSQPQLGKRVETSQKKNRTVSLRKEKHDTASQHLQANAKNGIWLLRIVFALLVSLAAVGLSVILFDIFKDSGDTKPQEKKIDVPTQNSKAPADVPNEQDPAKKTTAPTDAPEPKADDPTKKARYRRGFGDTIVKYEDRAYEKAAWRLVYVATSVSQITKRIDKRRPDITLHGVTGWDDKSFWVTCTTDDFSALACRYRDGSWSGEEVKTNSIGRTRQRLIDQDTLLLATGNRLYKFSPNGTVDFGIGADYATEDWGEICAISPDLSCLFVSNFHSISKISNKNRIHQGEDLFITRGNIPSPERYVGGIKFTRTVAPGKVIGIHPGIRDNTDAPIVVSYQNAGWQQIAVLPSWRVNDIWVYAEGDSPRCVVAVGNEGRVCVLNLNGPKYELSVPAPNKTTSLKLLKVWGVSPENFWVMDNSGTVWQRKGANWQVVAQRLVSTDAFKDAWVSPTGMVIAIGRIGIFRLN